MEIGSMAHAAAKGSYKEQTRDSPERAGVCHWNRALREQQLAFIWMAMAS
jgi:hypothetical protein